MLDTNKQFNEKDPYSKNPIFKTEKKLNMIRNTCIRADMDYMNETSKEIFLAEPHSNDLYVQN
ncbi:MAG: hypothetical protein ACI35S_04440 [Anaeroplasma sp.]